MMSSLSAGSEILGRAGEGTAEAPVGSGCGGVIASTSPGGFGGGVGGAGGSAETVGTGERALSLTAAVTGGSLRSRFSAAWGCASGSARREARTSPATSTAPPPAQIHAPRTPPVEPTRAKSSTPNLNVAPLAPESPQRARPASARPASQGRRSRGRSTCKSPPPRAHPFLRDTVRRSIRLATVVGPTKQSGNCKRSYPASSLSGSRLPHRIVGRLRSCRPARAHPRRHLGNGWLAGPLAVAIGWARPVPAPHSVHGATSPRARGMPWDLRAVP